MFQRQDIAQQTVHDALQRSMDQPAIISTDSQAQKDYEFQVKLLEMEAYILVSEKVISSTNDSRERALASARLADTRVRMQFLRDEIAKRKDARNLLVRTDSNGIRWIAFEWTDPTQQVEMEYTIRCDVQSIDTSLLGDDFKERNAVLVAGPGGSKYSGLDFCWSKQIGWALAQLNPCLENHKKLLQTAVENWRLLVQVGMVQDLMPCSAAEITPSSSDCQAQGGPSDLKDLFLTQQVSQLYHLAPEPKRSIEARVKAYWDDIRANEHDQNGAKYVQATQGLAKLSATLRQGLKERHQQQRTELRDGSNCDIIQHSLAKEQTAMPPAPTLQTALQQGPYNARDTHRALRDQQDQRPQDYQTQLMLLEQQCKHRCAMVNESTRSRRSRETESKN